MFKALCLLLFFLGTYCHLSGQTIPKEGSELNYRLIGFSFPAIALADNYTIQVASGNYTTEDQFKKNIVRSLITKKTKLIAEVPSFGEAYTWRVTYRLNGLLVKDSLHHFSTISVPAADTNVARLRILKNTGKYKNSYVFIEGTCAMYDMAGHPVWYLPKEKINITKEDIRDLKLTPQGSITFLTNNNIYEIDYNGNILWQYSNNVTNKRGKFFHHELSRLYNGHYMTLIYDNAVLKLPVSKSAVAINSADSSGFSQKTNLTSIIEYDENGNTVWRWSVSDYIKTSDLLSRKTKDGRFDDDLHENAFFFDEKSKNIYLSLKNVDRIIKIKYPEGNVLNTYGPECKQGILDKGNELFCDQHSCKLSQKGYLYLYNNNTCGTPHIPTVAMMREPGAGNGNLEKIWEYNCTLDEPDSAKKEKAFFYGGGNVQEMPDMSMFISMGAPYSKVLIVNPGKKVLWSAIPEKYDNNGKKWDPVVLYRASIVSDQKNIEQLIWNSEPKN